MDPNPDYHIYNSKAASKAIGVGILVVIYIINWIRNFISKTKKQADETTFANDTSAVKSNATQVTMPVLPSAAATISSQTTAVTANTDTTYNGYYTTATQISAVTANTDTTYNGYYTTATQIPAVTANTAQSDQLDDNFRNEMKHNQPYHFLQNYESRFNANFILHGGFEIKNHPKYSCIPNNYKNFESNYINYLNEENLQKEFIYNVGE
jgi:hypothetical protein